MDEGLRACLDEVRLDFNNAQDRLLNRLSAWGQDFKTPKVF